MNGFNLFAQNSGAGFSMPSFLKDPDNVLILVLILMLMKEKSNRALVISLMSILMQN
jgi:lipoprotein signal peptidase